MKKIITFVFALLFVLSIGISQDVDTQPCTDGTAYGQCSVKSPGFYCHESGGEVQNVIGVYPDDFPVESKRGKPTPLSEKCACSKFPGYTEKNGMCVDSSGEPAGDVAPPEERFDDTPQEDGEPDDGQDSDEEVEKEEDDSDSGEETDAGQDDKEKKESEVDTKSDESSASKIKKISGKTTADDGAEQQTNDMTIMGLGLFTCMLGVFGIIGVVVFVALVAFALMQFRKKGL